MPSLSSLCKHYTMSNTFKTIARCLNLQFHSQKKCTLYVPKRDIRLLNDHTFAFLLYLFTELDGRFNKKCLLKATCMHSKQSITNELLPSLTREDLRDLLPGLEHFLRRKHIWEAVHEKQKTQLLCISCL